METCEQPASATIASIRCRSADWGVVCLISVLRLPRPAGAQRAYKPGLAAAGVHDLLDQVRGGGFSVGAGHTERAEVQARVIEVLVGEKRQGEPDIGHLQVRHRAALPGFLRNDACGATLHRLGDELVAVGVLAGDADKGVARLYLPRVVTDAGHHQRPRACRPLYAQQFQDRLHALCLALLHQPTLPPPICAVPRLDPKYSAPEGCSTCLPASPESFQVLPIEDIRLRACGRARSRSAPCR